MGSTYIVDVFSKNTPPLFPNSPKLTTINICNVILFTS